MSARAHPMFDGLPLVESQIAAIYVRQQQQVQAAKCLRRIRYVSDAPVYLMGSSARRARRLQINGAAWRFSDHRVDRFSRWRKLYINGIIGNNAILGCQFNLYLLRVVKRNIEKDLLVRLFWQINVGRIFGG